MKIFTPTFWDRVANVRLFTWGYLGYHLFSMVSMRLFLNSANFIEYLGFWLSIIVLEHVFIFSIYGLAKRFIRNSTLQLVIIGTLVLGVCRTLITTSLAIAVGADPGVAWGYQLVLGALWELLILVLWANLNGAFRDHNKVVRELNETRNSILGYRDNAELILAEEQEKLIELTHSTLLPQLQLIEDAIHAGPVEMAARWGVAHELKGIINNQVRPLSDSLRRAAKSLSAPALAKPNHWVSVISIPKTFRIQNSIFPFYTYAAMFLAFLAAPFWLLDISWVIPSVLMSFTYFVLILGLKRLFANTPTVPVWVGIPAIIVTAVIPVLPTYLVAINFYPNIKTAAVFGSALVYVSLIVVGILALLNSFDYEARLYRKHLEDQNEVLSIESALFEQQLWVARRNWSLVIHGTVQASLTAALTRLNAPDSESKTLVLAKKDLERAMAALSSPPTLNVKFTQAIKEIVETWNGVCDIKIDIDPSVKKLVTKDSHLSMCVNEIMKEAISNAVRHGDAHNAKVSLKLADNGLLKIVISNDGYTPRLGGRKGLGSNLLDELTVDWSLGFDSATDQTILTARLPFSVPSA